MGRRAPRSEETPDPVRSRLVRQSNQTEVPKRLFDGLALFGRARFDATTLPGAVRCPARRQASKRFDMSDPTGLRDEAVMLLNELLYLNVGRHSCHPRARARAWPVSMVPRRRRCCAAKVAPPGAWRDI